jgi:hypothetical protein
MPGPDSHLDEYSFVNRFRDARRNKRISQELKNVILKKCSDGKLAAFNLPFQSLDIWNLFRRRVVFVTDPEYAKIICNGKASQFPKARRYNRLKFAFGDGLLTAEGDFHKDSRKLLNPGFHAEALRGMVSVFDEKTRDLMTKWRQEVTENSGEPTRVDLNNFFTKLTMNVIFEAGFGYNPDGVEKIVDPDTGKPLEIDISHGVSFILDEINRRLSGMFDVCVTDGRLSALLLFCSFALGLICTCISVLLGAVSSHDMTPYLLCQTF